MAGMTVVRFILVFLFYVAAELMSPVAATAVEVMDGEAESSQHGGQRRLSRVAAAKDHAATERRDAALRAARRASAPAPARAPARGDAPRKVPAPVPESPPAPDDH